MYTRIFELAAWRPEYVNRDGQQQQKSTKGRERFLETITLQSPLFLPHVWISRGEGATICLSLGNRMPFLIEFLAGPQDRCGRVA